MSNIHLHPKLRPQEVRKQEAKPNRVLVVRGTRDDTPIVYAAATFGQYLAACLHAVDVLFGPDGEIFDASLELPSYRETKPERPDYKPEGIWALPLSLQETARGQFARYEQELATWQREVEILEAIQYALTNSNGLVASRVLEACSRASTYKVQCYLLEQENLSEATLVLPEAPTQ